ncbi:hypothetical protein K491DRAFT_439432 [Lophiostoma macrostomum CBS 122681]|uniref:Uncharacterized protein n=1 Tax=Lophiostoma macrostomum CBS 122681 TaxID=1314788 RepID=A0A6A6T794_9PLEO|nr:hypothetical protein K491DRAFT_439432 [Lophiostoma macrostomum CBS 122681]
MPDPHYVILERYWQTAAGQSTSWRAASGSVTYTRNCTSPARCGRADVVPPLFPIKVPPRHSLQLLNTSSTTSSSFSDLVPLSLPLQLKLSWKFTHCYTLLPIAAPLRTHPLSRAPPSSLSPLATKPQALLPAGSSPRSLFPAQSLRVIFSRLVRMPLDVSFCSLDPASSRVPAVPTNTALVEIRIHTLDRP